MENAFIREPGNTFGIKDLTPKETKKFEKTTQNSVNEGFVGYKMMDRNVKGSLLPTAAYQSQTEIYGGHLKTDEKRTVIFNIGGKLLEIKRKGKLLDAIDVRGDRLLRTFDDNAVRNPLEMLKRHPKQLLKRIVNHAKRYRANNPKETYEVIKRLGLEEYYGPHEEGLVIKKPEILTDGTGLLDIFRQDIIKNEELNKVDRFEALRETTLYIKNLHNQRQSGLGDLAIMDIVFQKRENGKVSNPVVLIPNMLYNPKLNIPLREQKATDLIDLIFSAGTEEVRRTQGDQANVTKVVDTILNAYDEPDVIRFIRSYMKRGRLTMPGEGNSVQRPRSPSHDSLRTFLSMHMQERMKGDTATDAGLRSLTISRCEEYGKMHTSSPTTTEKPQFTP